MASERSRRSSTRGLPRWRLGFGTGCFLGNVISCFVSMSFTILHPDDFATLQAITFYGRRSFASPSGLHFHAERVYHHPNRFQGGDDKE